MVSPRIAFRRPPAHFSVLPSVATPSDRRSLRTHLSTIFHNVDAIGHALRGQEIPDPIAFPCLFAHTAAGGWVPRWYESAGHLSRAAILAERLALGFTEPSSLCALAESAAFGVDADPVARESGLNPTNKQHP